VKYRELTKKVRGTGCHEIARRGGGSHRKWVNPATGRGTTIPDWGEKVGGTAGRGRIWSDLWVEMQIDGLKTDRISGSSQH
jgi:predicted RNA binding protein YcfA (HicA-like mRNA interferase family)